jgi:hypothetical protein
LTSGVIAQGSTLSDLRDALKEFSSLESSKLASLLRQNLAVSEKVGFAEEQTLADGHLQPFRLGGRLHATA